MRIVIADCNHGFFGPEQEECTNLGVDLDIVLCHEKDISTQCKHSDVLIVQRHKVNGQIVDQLPNCKVVTRYGVGLDNLQCEELRSRNIKIVSFPGFCTEEVANHAMACIMFLHRKLDIVQRCSKNLISQWGNPHVFGGLKSAQTTKAGIVGLGSIGKALADRLLACGFSVGYYDPYIKHENAVLDRYPTIEDLFKKCNIVSLHVPLTNETQCMVNKDLFKLMPQNSIFINTSRGPIVCTQDLVDHLKLNLRAAYIDVVDPEPPPSDLFDIDNLFISHHCAFYSDNSLDYLKRRAISDSVEAYQDAISGNQDAISGN